MQNNENEKTQVISGKANFDKVINEIETLLDCGFKVPPFGSVVSTKEVKSQLISLKKAVQEAVEEAEHVLNIKDQIIYEAHQEAKEIIRRKQLEVAKQPAIKEAEAFAKKMLFEVKKQTEEMKRDAEVFQKDIKEKALQFADSVFNEIDKGLHENRKKVSRNRQELKMMFEGTIEEQPIDISNMNKEDYNQQRQML